jgi:hypothetical protein
MPITDPESCLRTCLHIPAHRASLMSGTLVLLPQAGTVTNLESP